MRPIDVCSQYFHYIWSGVEELDSKNNLFSLLHRAYCSVTQLLYQLLHIYNL